MAGHGRRGEKGCAYWVLVATTEGKKPLTVRKRRWDGNGKTDLKEMEYEVVSWINLAHVRGK